MTVPAHALALALAAAGFGVADGAHAQDTRDVREPHSPPAVSLPMALYSCAQPTA